MQEGENMTDTYTQLFVCDCSECERNCAHRDTFRRYPESMGGLGLCPNLKEGEVNDKNRENDNDQSSIC